MTAEIALLNRAALAFAADSAVTIRVGTSQKIYDSAEKIFEFSRCLPIALMIYNNVEHVGVPLDVLVRSYRRTKDKIYESIKDACDSFLDYLEAFPHSDGEENAYLFNALAGKYDTINDEIVKRRRLHAGRARFSFTTTFSEILLEQTILEESRALPDYLSAVTASQFEERFGRIAQYAAFDTIRALNVDEYYRAEVLRHAFAVMKSDISSDVMTGYVFGGYGKSDLFPTLHYVEIDGIYFGKLKRTSRRIVDIDRMGDRAQIIPFAQTDMADRFIYGVDEDFKKEVVTYVEEAIDAVLSVKPRMFTRVQRSEIKNLVTANFLKTIDKLRGKERKDIVDIVNFMSRKELGEMALALVELTSKKRRFSTEQETVGGPIDVAVVSRNEGFIWIRRKHYFEQEANPGYFMRAFGAKVSGDDNGGK